MYKIKYNNINQIYKYEKLKLIKSKNFITDHIKYLLLVHYFNL